MAQLPTLKEELSESKRLTLLGSGVTVLYVACWSAYAWVNWSSFVSMKPHEIGDFFAGTSAGLAFFWFVLAYLQQGRELKQNSSALLLQADEMRNAVEQAKNQVAAQHASVDVARMNAILEIHRQGEDGLSNVTLGLLKALREVGTIHVPPNHLRLDGNWDYNAILKSFDAGDHRVFSYAAEAALTGILLSPHLSKFRERVSHDQPARHRLLTAIRQYQAHLNSWESRLVVLNAEDDEVELVTVGIHADVGVLVNDLDKHLT